MPWRDDTLRVLWEKECGRNANNCGQRGDDGGSNMATNYLLLKWWSLCSHPFILCWPCDLLWPTECGRSDVMWHLAASELPSWNHASTKPRKEAEPRLLKSEKPCEWELRQPGRWPPPTALSSANRMHIQRSAQLTPQEVEPVIPARSTWAANSQTHDQRNHCCFVPLSFWNVVCYTSNCLIYSLLLSTSLGVKGDNLPDYLLSVGSTTV